MPRIAKRIIKSRYNNGTIGGGTYPNLYLCSSAISNRWKFWRHSRYCEMLLQSHGNDEVIPFYLHCLLMRFGNRVVLAD
ncbi:MAG: hypothetical protein IPI98_00410 [Chitinophagaceae bacterium]|nr:hypothetical protein [Chitinophagaceae bacterium]